MMDHEADRRLGQRIDRIKRHWPWVMAGVGVCGLLSFVLSLFLPKVYRATTDLLVSESKVGPGLQLPSWQYTTLPTYVPFVDNDALIQQAITRFHLDRAPYRLSVDAFRRRDILDVHAVKSTRLLEINVEISDPRLAADLANFLAQGAVDFNNKMSATDTTATRAFLGRQLADATAHLAEASRLRTEVRSKARIEDREKELSILLADKEQLSTKLQMLRLNLAQDESRTKSLEQSLDHEPRTFQLTKNVISDRYAEKALEKSGSGGNPLPSISEETVNATEQEIRTDYVTAKADTAAERAGVSAATARLEKLNDEIAQQVVLLTRLRSATDKVDHEYALAREAVDVASRNYESASVNVSAKSQDLEQLAPAVVPSQPVSPKPVLNTILGMLIGLILFGGGAMTRESFRDLNEARWRPIEDDHPVSVSR